MNTLSVFAVVFLLIQSSLTCGPLPRDLVDEVPQYAPISPSALGIPNNSDGYAVEAFGKGAYMVTGKIIFEKLASLLMACLVSLIAMLLIQDTLRWRLSRYCTYP